ncbi:hypothetical protein EGI32_10340 [Ferruginibacter sp. HRS2-29]|nr:hypothetical protein [Ferruginibacter sp. HRS2-29]
MTGSTLVATAFRPGNDSVNVPECIKKLSRPGSKSIRSYNGGQQFTKPYTLKNGKTVFAFNSEASIGCNSNQPAGTKYFDDSCRMIAYFPGRFSIRQGFKPFVANEYEPTDFPEASTGDYPVYFAELAKTTQENNAKVRNPFPVEKTFRIGKKEDNSLDFKTGDIIRISTRNGLRHYRNNVLVNNYKILPQLAIFTIEAKCKVAPCFTIDKNEVVFYLDGSQRFIDIRNNTFFVSINRYSYLNKPASTMRIPWKKAYQLTEL